MDPTILPPLSGHAILILLLQLAGLLLLARALAELMRRLGQPAVIGELLAGILLGPTVLGHFAPALFTAVFPPDVAQFHLLEVISWLGLVLLLLLTGLETDLRVVRTLGPSALFASAGGLTVLFVSGTALGLALPDRFLVSPDQRPLFAALLATALAITALPVIGKILIDLNIIKRNLGVVTLSAGVVDDTVGWLVLGVIAGFAEAGTFSLSKLLLTLVSLAIFLLALRYLVYPVFGRVIRYTNENVGVGGADLTLILVGTFLAAAATEAIGVHAVFGAFVFGLMVRQVPRVRAPTLHTLEQFVLSCLSPIFFAFVGIKVNLWTLTSWQVPLLVIAVAVAGKTVGCYTGARIGRMAHWEALALAFGMNARGAMGLIVALIGLSLGLLTSEMFSIVVLMAVVTSFLAPVLLRLVLPKLPITEEERRRLEAGTRRTLLPEGALRVLVPTAGGGNAMGAFALAAPLVRERSGSLTALYVERTTEGRRWPWTRFLDPSAGLAGRGLEHHLEQAAARLGDQRKRLTVRRVRSEAPADAVLEESVRDYDLLMIGAAPRHLVGHSMIAQVLAGAKLPAVIVRSTEHAPPPVFRRVLVPVEGSLVSRLAAEFAFAYAGAARARVTLLHVLNEARVFTGAIAIPESRETHALNEAEEEGLTERLRADYGTIAAEHEVPFDVRILASGDPGGTIIDESQSDYYDLLVLGAENKMLAQPLFFGQGTATIVERAGCTTAVVVPPTASARGE
ncbi:MAG TPA: cation:proton antiporter [Gemmatimonadaceae bacterium]|nr:cation:proton antiporter [Gemmatimonadaceae bacterium]